MATRRLVVEVVGDTDKLEKALGRGGQSTGKFGKQVDAADKQAGKFRTSLVGVGKVAGLGLAAGVGVGAVAVKGFVKAASDSEASTARMRAQLKALGISFNGNAKQIDKVIQKHSALSGLDDEDLQDSFTNIVRTTGDVNKALKLNAVAADLARAKHMDVAKAGDIVAKVAGGNTGILSRYGITIEKGATSTEALGLLQRKFAGQAKAYGDTSAGAQEKFKVAVENLQETLGAKLLPVVTKIANAIVNFILQLQNGEGAGGRFRDAIVGAFNTVKGAITTALGAVQGFISTHQVELDRAAQAARNVGAAAVWAFQKVLLPIVKAVWPAVEGIVKGAVTAIGGAVQLLTGLLTGDFGKAWEGVKDIFRGGITAIKGILEGAFNIVKIAAGFIVSGVIDGIKALPGLLLDVGKWILNRVVDGVKALPGVIKAVGGWLLARAREGIQASLEGWKLIGGWVLNRIVDGFKIVTELLKSVGGWIKNRIGEFIRAELEGLKVIGSWIVNRIVDGFKTVTEGLASVGGWLKNRLVDIFDKVKDGIVGIGGTIIGWIVDGLKGGANALVGFVNKIIGVINKIPGVNIGKVEGFAEGGKTGVGGRAQALARGGVVNRPIVMMGEEAPRHPEYVIPTNPAYRDRARMLLGQAAGAIGFATGGVFDATSYGPPWTGINGTGVTATGVDLRPARQAYGVAVDPNVIKLGSRMKIWPNPFDYKGAFSAFDTGSAIKGRRLDFYDWRGRAEQYGWGSRQVRVGAGAVGPGIGSIAGNVVNALNPAELINNLPGIGDLPGWLKGTGTHILKAAKKYITDKVGGMFGGGGDGGNIKGSVEKAIAFAATLGFPRPTGAQLFRPGGPTLHGQGRAADFGDAGRTPKQMQSLFYGLFGQFGSSINELFYDRMPWFIDAHQKRIGQYGGHDDHIHIGFAKGGVFGGLPFLGSFHNGGVAPREGFAHVAAGERMTMPGQGGPMVHVEQVVLGSHLDENSFLERLAFRVATA